MKNIKITKENYEAYRTFHKAKCGCIDLSVDTKLVKKIISFLTASVVLILFLGTGITCSLMVSSSNETTRVLITLLGSLATMGGSFIIPIIGVNRFAINEEKKEYPDLDFEVDINELGEELELFEKLSRIPKNIEKHQEEHLTKFDDVFKNMSADERIAFFRKRKSVLDAG